MSEKLEDVDRVATLLRHAVDGRTFRALTYVDGVGRERVSPDIMTFVKDCFTLYAADGQGVLK